MRMTTLLAACMISLLLLQQPAHAVRVNNLRTCSNSETPLQRACEKGDFEVVKALLKHGASANEKNSHGTKPIIFAVGSGNTQVLELLVDNGARVDEEDPANHMFPINFAISAKVAKCLLDHGANVNSVAGDFGSPLCQAVRRGDYETAKLLLSRRADTEIRETVALCDDTGVIVEIERLTALLDAAEHGSLNLVRLLVESGAKIDARVESGKLPKDRRSYHVGPVMSKVGSSLAAGQTAVDIAKLRGFSAVAKYLRTCARRSAAR